MRAWSSMALVLGTAALVAGSARADELRDLLKAGPLVRVEQTEKGRFKRVLSMADVDAPVALVWEVLNTQEKFKEFMPRVDELSVKVEAPNKKLVSYELDTPFVDTTYTLRWTSHPADNTIQVEQVYGDLKGSAYEWRLVSLGPELTRIYYSGVTKNFSSFANKFEDDQQTITVGLNVVSMLAGLKAIKLRSESIHRTRRTVSAPATEAAP